MTGSGGTCDLVGQQSEGGYPGLGPHHGFPHRPRLTRGHCCMEDFHCPPAGSWCCNLEKERNKHTAESFKMQREDSLKFLGHWEVFLPLQYIGANTGRLSADAKVIYL